MKYSLQPITQQEAFRFISAHHRHHDEPQGWLFGVAVNDGERIVGVAVVGRPVARMLQNGFTAEVTRVCIVEDLETVKDREGTEHAAPVASMLYSNRMASCAGARISETNHLHARKRNRKQRQGCGLARSRKSGRWTMDQAITSESRNEKPGAENTLGADVKSCSVCGYTEQIGIPGITYSRIGPYPGLCFDCLSGKNQ